MKRCRHVTLVLLGTTALAGCQDDWSAPPQPTAQQFAESLALPVPKPHCDRPEDFPRPECHDPQAPVAAASSGHASSSGGHGGAGIFWFFHGGGSSYGPSTPAAHAYAAAGPAVRAAAPAGTTSFGGFGSIGRAMASFGGGS